jgi:hypothetical protein
MRKTIAIRGGGRIELLIGLAVMHSDPLLPEVGHSPFRQPAIVQRALHKAGAGHPPIAAMAAGGSVNLRRVDAQPDEVPPPDAGALPLLMLLFVGSSALI